MIAVTIRWRGDGRIPPFDDLYHLKRIESPHVILFDPDRGERGAFCPWPPLYDVVMAALPRGHEYVPPIFFAAFCAVVAFVLGRFGWLAAATAGLTLALSPYLIGISMVGHIDHHYVEPALVLGILAARRRPVLLGIAIAVALFVQTALLVAAVLVFFDRDRAGRAITAAGTAALLIVIYRVFMPTGYPNGPWFLGYPHAIVLICAAIHPVALIVPLAFPSVAGGLHFFGGDPWLSSIVEFQPMLRNAATIGTDLANLTGGAFLSLLLWRRHRAFSLFAAIYLVLALTSHRFLVPAAALFAIGGALAAAHAKKPWLAWAAALVTVLPPLIYDVSTFRQPEPSHEEFRVIGERMAPLPRGRVLAPWSFGHSIDVLGHKPVVIDNFGSMPDAHVFTNAIEAMLTTRVSLLEKYCRERDIRYLVLPHPAYVAATAATIGIDPELYSRTRLARRTVWSRLYSGEQIPGFTRISDDAISIWKIE